MRGFLTLSLAIAGLAAAPALAGEPDKPVTQRDPSATDVATTPLSDLNLRKGEIPPLLQTAVEKPYDLSGLARCPQLASAIGELDAVLGDDIDLPAEGSNGITAGRVAQSVVGSFIPFRGIIREVSGANEQQRRLQAAIYAGVARRSFLKGYGQARGCRYPARSAPADVVAARQRAAASQQNASNQRNSGQQQNSSSSSSRNNNRD